MAARHAVDGNVLHAATATTVGTGKASPVESTVSAGAVTVRLPGSRPEDVLARAGQAMNSARRAGGDQVSVVEIDRGRPLVVAKRTVGHTTGSSA